MPISLNQSNNSYPSNGPIVLGNAAAGSLLVAWLSGNNGANNTTLPAGWTICNLSQGGSGATSVSGRFFYYQNWPGGNVSAAITSPPTDCGWFVFEYLGIAISNALQAQNNFNAVSANWLSGLVTTSEAIQLLVAAFAEEYGATTLTWGNNFSQIAAQADHFATTANLITPSAGNYQATATAGGSNQYAGAVLAFLALAAATVNQESFRFRLDDGNEAGASWDGSQDANLTKDAGNERLRFIIDASGDPAANAYQLEWSKVGEDVWRKVEN